MERRRYPREFLVAEIKRIARLVGDIPSMDEFDEHSEIAAVTVAKRFKGWRNALGSAGFDSAKSRNKYDDQELKEEIKRVAKELGRAPSTTEFDRRSSVSSSLVAKRLGGKWAAACRAAGLSPLVVEKRPPSKGGWNKGQRKFHISKDELSYLYETEGLSASAIATRLGTSRHAVLRSLREHAIEIKRLHYSMPRETTIETLMYRELERRNVPFARRQVVDGRYEVDAIIMNARIVIECDGDYWHSLPGRPEKDAKREKYLKSRGYLVLRFPEAALRADIQKCGQLVVDALFERIKR